MYRAIDERGQVVDVLLRAHRDPESARVLFVLAMYHPRVAPEEMITDKHPAYARAIREEVPPGRCICKSGCTERAGRTQSRLSVHTSRRRIGGGRCAASSRSAPGNAREGDELARAAQRGDVAAPDPPSEKRCSPHARAGAAATFAWLAEGLRVAA